MDKEYQDRGHHAGGEGWPGGEATMMRVGAGAAHPASAAEGMGTASFAKLNLHAIGHTTAAPRNLV